MDAKLKADWVAALRSGKYEQGSGNLCLCERYCCLGVFAVVAGAKFDQHGSPYLDGDEVRKIGSEYLSERFSGIDYLTQTKLAQLNDEEGLGFPAIADWIEANIPADPSSLPLAEA